MDGRRSHSPGRKAGSHSPARGSRSPARTVATPDRFIPSRMDRDAISVSHAKIVADLTEKTEENVSPNTKASREQMAANLAAAQGVKLDSKIILHYEDKPAPKQGTCSAQLLYQSSSSAKVKKTHVERHIPTTAERVLDAPELMDDFYLNLIDWSANNHLAIALGGVLYLWNASSGDIQQLFEMEHESSFISAVSWIPDGKYLAVGTSDNEVQLWDVAVSKCLRRLRTHGNRVGTLAWNKHILTSGDRCGEIQHHDVRAPNHMMASFKGHSQEVCGLKWSPSGNMLASGGNDNTLLLWPGYNNGGVGFGSGPIHTITEHTAAVKALAWCPFQSHCLASGGGTSDRHIRLWNAQNGRQVASVDTKSQVCGLLWNETYGELISGHGYPKNQLTVWRYPQLEQVAELSGHTERILYMSASPDNTTVVSGSADETIRLWKCWEVDEAALKKKMASAQRASGTSKSKAKPAMQTRGLR
ncbi:cell division cycle protein 20 homolog [Sycon ciliatum]|uniref:cell division cycle protein 20 homolog n=1 Tax=Sycon ciliatum TaxID=27933 RepID=UPI0020ABE1EA|eukprot:scpid66432/ scgid15997/ Cell division cycle protein 20 homolog; p55CDC